MKSLSCVGVFISLEKETCKSRSCLNRIDKRDHELKQFALQEWKIAEFLQKAKKFSWYDPLGFEVGAPHQQPPERHKKISTSQSAQIGPISRAPAFSLALPYTIFSYLPVALLSRPYILLSLILNGSFIHRIGSASQSCYCAQSFCKRV